MTNKYNIRLITYLNLLVVDRKDKKRCFELNWNWVILTNTNDKEYDHRIEDGEFCPLVFQKCYRKHGIPIPRKVKVVNEIE